MTTPFTAPDLPLPPNSTMPLDPGTAPHVEDQDAAIVRLLRHLQGIDYRFVTPTPATHARIVSRRQDAPARSLRDVLGWSLPFESGTIDPDVEYLLHQADMLEVRDRTRRSRIRVSSLSGQLFVHSAYPTAQPGTVFFGPDSYRFANLLLTELPKWSGPGEPHIVDIGTGSGVGAIIASQARLQAHVRMTDINPLALRFARINAAAAGAKAVAVECSMLDAIEGRVDIVTANPPYIIDPESRLYRDGGAMRGGEVSLNMAKAALDRLAPGGRLILYTGSAIVDGLDAFKGALEREAGTRDMKCRYQELDPDIFGEELDKTVYQDVERIALVAAVLERPA